MEETPIEPKLNSVQLMQQYNAIFNKIIDETGGDLDEITEEDLAILKQAELRELKQNLKY